MTISFVHWHGKPPTERLPEALVAGIEAESRDRGFSISEIVRKRRLRSARSAWDTSTRLTAIDHVIGSFDDQPADLRAKTNEYFSSAGYGRSRAR